ncbi:PREDICTED: uncharacterized protein LOC108560073 [Nicrophorus vespilloides]|uniref:Uncharacterized protein LOC108560073 n=1 Tax=Nicrophorus vespilloides TaxID=110193 RepID=A0ABM1MEK3_NICVS|nr:PREDICTED: uncharacterized protein LOC108560073 [Nicrophorus vespilloides]
MFAAPLTVFMNLIAEKYFQNSTCVYQNHDLLIDIARIPAVLESCSPQIQHDCEVLVIKATLLDHIEDMYKFRGYSQYNKRKYVIIAETPMEVELIFKARALKFIADLLIILVEEEECNSLFCFTPNVILQLFTHRFVGLNGNNDKMLIDVWFSRNSSFLHGDKVLFPEKIKNQQGRNFTVASFSYLPFSDFESKEGSELMLIYEYTKRHNSTFVYKKKGPWGTVNKDFTGTGMFGALVSDESDVALNGLFLEFDIYRFFDVSHSYTFLELTCLAPPPKISIDWKFLLPRMNSSFLIVTLLTFALMVLLLCVSRIHSIPKYMSSRLTFYQYVEMFVSNILMIMRTQLQQPSNEINRSAFRIKLNLFLMFLTSVVLTSKYSMGLSSVIAVPYYDGAINSPEDMADRNMKWMAFSIDSWLNYIKYDETKVYRKIRENSLELDVTKINEDVGFGIQRLLSGFYVVNSNLNDSILKSHRIMNNYVYRANCVFFLRKNSILLPSFNKLLLEAHQAGLGIKWETDSILNSMGLSKQFALVESTYKLSGSQKLKYDHIRGVLGIWFFGSVASIICFILELSTMLNCRC